MSERDLVFLATGIWIGTTCGILLAAMFAAGAAEDRAVERAMREDFDELERQAHELNHGFTNSTEVRA